MGGSGVSLELVGTVHQSNTSRGVIAMNGSVVRYRSISDPAAGRYPCQASNRFALRPRKQTDRCTHVLRRHGSRVTDRFARLKAMEALDAWNTGLSPKRTEVNIVAYWILELVLMFFVSK
eukprot:gene6609-biopygen4409